MPLLDESLPLDSLQLKMSAMSDTEEASSVTKEIVGHIWMHRLTHNLSFTRKFDTKLKEWQALLESVDLSYGNVSWDWKSLVSLPGR